MVTALEAGTGTISVGNRSIVTNVPFTIRTAFVGSYTLTRVNGGGMPATAGSTATGCVQSVLGSSLTFRGGLGVGQPRLPPMGLGAMTMVIASMKILTTLTNGSTAPRYRKSRRSNG
jgi:hypothetical protein